MDIDRIGIANMGRILMPLLITVCLAACATVASVTNLSTTACAAQMQRGLSEILVEQGESANASESMARQTLSTLSGNAHGPRPFLVAAPSGTDYEFFVQKKRETCLLRLYGRYHGFVSYTNNLTYIATRPLAGCECSE